MRWANILNSGFVELIELYNLNIYQFNRLYSLLPQNLKTRFGPIHFGLVHVLLKLFVVNPIGWAHLLKG